MSMSKWYEHIKPNPGFYYSKSSFNCGDGYLTGIHLENGYAGSDINAVTFTCSNGITGSFTGGFSGPKHYTYTVPTGISSLTIGSGNAQVAFIIPSINLTGNYPLVQTFTCPTGSFINRIDAKLANLYPNLTDRMEYIGGFSFGCTTPPSSQSAPPSSSKSNNHSSSKTSSSSSSSSKTGLIIGIVLVIIVIIAVVIFVVYYIHKRKKEKKLLK